MWKIKRSHNQQNVSCNKQRIQKLLIFKKAAVVLPNKISQRSKYFFPENVVNEKEKNFKKK